MPISRPNKRWTLITILLIVVIAISGGLACSRYPKSQPIEISLPPTQELQGEIYVGGAVNNPGLYPLGVVDSIEDIIQAAGNITSNADLTRVEFYIPAVEEEQQPQKVNLNRAEAWLLEALPGIGETRAQAIIDYRNQNGPFHNTYELTKVEGIGTATYEQIKHLITVAD